MVCTCFHQTKSFSPKVSFSDVLRQGLARGKRRIPQPLSLPDHHAVLLSEPLSDGNDGANHITPVRLVQVAPHLPRIRNGRPHLFQYCVP